MSDHSKLEYCIVDYNAEERIVSFEIKDEGLYNIKLMKPFPESIEDVEDMIRDHGYPVEYYESLEETPVFDFIFPEINKKRETYRKRVGLIFDEEEEALIEANEHEQLKKAVREVLAEYGINKE